MSLRSTRMKRTVTTLLVCLVAMFMSISVFGQTAKGAEASTTAKSGEMPPALQNMQGKPGYDQEHQKWVQSQNVTPEQQKAQAAKAVQQLNGATWKAPQVPTVTKSSSEGSPYHNYKGISDPEKAKAAWAKDQAPKNGN